MKGFTLSLFILLVAITAKAQFVPGFYYDINGEKVPGLINRFPSGKGIEKDEGFIEFKEVEKDRPQRLSASMIHGFIVGKDSFIVAHAPRYGGAWSKNELDFVKVVVDGPTKLYVMSGGSGGGNGGGSRIQPMMATGIGTGGVGFSPGLSINLGGRGGNGGGAVRNAYYYGENTTEMRALTDPKTFVDIMSDVMGDEPAVVEKIRDGTFDVSNVDGLVKYYNTIVAGHNKK
jgi:hypothetical protein